MAALAFHRQIIWGVAQFHSEPRSQPKPEISCSLRQTLHLHLSAMRPQWDALLCPVTVFWHYVLLNLIQRNFTDSKFWGCNQPSFLNSSISSFLQPLCLLLSLGNLVISPAKFMFQKTICLHITPDAQGIHPKPSCIQSTEAIASAGAWKSLAASHCLKQNFTHSNYTVSWLKHCKWFWENSCQHFNKSSILDQLFSCY